MHYIPSLFVSTPRSYRLKHGWPSLSQAFKGVHIFDSSINISLIEAARERVAFEELFVRQSVLLRNRALSVSNESHEIPQKNKTVVDCVRKNIRFAPTRCQEAAVVSIEQDLASPLRMVRLLQGDVGSGKTVVSALAAAYTVASGRQCGYLAPTEMLAKQHFERLVEYFRDVYINGSSSSSPCRPVRVDLITGAVRGKVREQLLHRMRCGDVDVLVGTHALLSEEVLSSFPRLGLAVIDEEQRFGVAQRESIADRVNVLYTTATPIPRSLMMVSHAN
jgi:ATP-dependent DNA helicase RecG